MIKHHTINGLTYLHKAGIGRPLVFLHGISSYGLSFKGLMEATIRPTYAFDLPGYGGSVAISEKSHASDFARILQQAIDDLGLTNYTLLGSSLGGLIASYMATSATHLVLVGAALGYNTENYPTSVSQRLEEVANDLEGYAENRSARLVYNKTELAAVKASMRAMRIEGLKSASYALSTGDLLGQALTIKTPTHVFVGENDLIAPPENSLKIVQVLGLNCASYIKIPQAGHALVQEKPVILAKLLEQMT